MTEKLLRDTLLEAQEKDQLGLLIWANWTVWDDLGFEMWNQEMKATILLFLKSLKEKKEQFQLNGMDSLCLDLSQYRYKSWILLSKNSVPFDINQIARIANSRLSVSHDDYSYISKELSDFILRFEK